MALLEPEWKRSIRQTMTNVVALVLVFSLAPISPQRWWLGVIVGLLVVVGSVPLMVKRMKAVSSSSSPYLEAGLAILMMVAMVVVGFAAVYVGLSKHNQQFPSLHTKLDGIYFTVTTLATVGYGDLAPAGQLARGVAVIQMIVDILVIGVAARLAMRVASREAEARKS